MSDGKKVRTRKVGKAWNYKKVAKKPKPKMAKEKKGVKPPKAFHPEVVEACKRYGAANAGVGKVEGSVELAKWARAAEAYSVMVAAQKHKQAYIAAAVKLCGVRRSIVTMDCKAEVMRLALKVEAKELPKDSLSGFYELHRAQEAALAVAGENEDARAAVPAKVKKVGKALVAGDLSVRDIRKEFAEEFKALRKARKKGDESDGEETAPTVPPVVERADAEGLKSLIDKLISVSGGTVSVIKVTPEQPTAKGVAASLTNDAFHDALGEVCATKGPLWILVDRGPVSGGGAATIDVVYGRQRKNGGVSSDV